MKRASKLLSVLLAVAILLVTFLSVSVPAYAETADTGYAAVGLVDATACKAEVLLGTGEQGWVKFTGTAPTAGAVYKFSRDDANVYTFSELKAGPNADIDQLTDAGINVQFGGAPHDEVYQPYMWDGNTILYGYFDDTPVFIRFSATEWSVFDWNLWYEVIGNDGSVTVYPLDLSPATRPTQTYDVGAGVIGQCENGAISASLLYNFGDPWPEKDLGTFSDALHDYGEEEPPTDPTEAPTDPTEAPTDPTEAPTDPTVAPTDPTEPEKTEPTESKPTQEKPTDPDPEEPGDNTLLIVIIAAVVVAAVAVTVMVIIRKKSSKK